MKISVFRTSLVAFVTIAFVACGDSENTQQSDGFLGSTLASMQRDTQRGAGLTRRKCASCHNLERNLRKVGPSLKGVFGRVPVISGVPFEVWDEQALDLWLAGANKVKPNTTMAIPGIKSPEDRKAIINYLKQI
ncbi:MAG: c-type cytochrome [Mariprofundaceae bacterium]